MRQSIVARLLSALFVRPFVWLYVAVATALHSLVNDATRRREAHWQARFDAAEDLHREQLRAKDWRIEELENQVRLGLMGNGLLVDIVTRERERVLAETAIQARRGEDARSAPPPQDGGAAFRRMFEQ